MRELIDFGLISEECFERGRLIKWLKETWKSLDVYTAYRTLLKRIKRCY